MLFPFREGHFMNTKGITLIELIIVLAVLAILAAVLIPNFFNVTDRARLRSDIQSARVIHNAMELYRLERGTQLSGDMAVILDTLRTAGFISNRTANIQTANAHWRVGDGLVYVYVRHASDNVRSIAASLPIDEREFVRGFN